VLTGDRETNESIMMEGTGGTKNEPFSPFLKGAKEVQPLPKRRKLPNERQGFTHKFTILATDRHGEPMPVKGYLTVGLYEDGTVGELFVKMAKQGSEVSGFVDAWAISVSMMLQFGVPINVIVQRFENMRFEPSGRIKDQRDLALSPIDYVCKYLHRKFINDEQV
jgi:ribonucleoside-diphosphate reductase alpha chain